MMLRKATFRQRCCVRSRRVGSLHAGTLQHHNPLIQTPWSDDGSRLDIGPVHQCLEEGIVRSSLAKTRPQAARWRISSIMGTGVRSSTVTPLTPRKSQRDRNLPLSFLIRKAGAAQGELDGRRRPAAPCFSISWRTVSSQTNGTRIPVLATGVVSGRMLM